MVTLTDRLNWNKAWDIPSRLLPPLCFPCFLQQFQLTNITHLPKYISRSFRVRCVVGGKIGGYFFFPFFTLSLQYLRRDGISFVHPSSILIISFTFVTAKEFLKFLSDELKL